jgi:hypothetical protein
METIYFWRCTSAVTGKRYSTRWRCTEAEARERLIDPERIECGAIEVQPVTSTPGGHWRSGLEPRHDGAMVQADGAVERYLKSAEGRK